MSDNFSIAEPSYNPAEVNSLSGLLDFTQKKILMNIEKVAPAQIISYDREKNRAVVQILNYSITSSGENIQRKPLYDIPVFCFGGGDFVLSFPIKENDIGFVIASDGDISVFKKLLKIFAPATYQKHKYKDGVFYPLILNGFTLSNDDKDAVILSSVDGKTKISLKDGEANIEAVNININATKTTLTTETIINGSLTVNGDINSSGTATISVVKSGNGSSGTYTQSVISADGIVTGGT